MVAEKKLGIVFTSDSKQAEKGIRDLNTALGSTETQAKKSGAGIKTALAGLAIGSFVKSGLDSLGEIDRLNKQTESAIKATGGAAHVTADEVTSLAGAIEKKTGIEAESIQSGQNMLLTFKGIRNEAGAGNDIFNQATQTLADMSTAMGTDASTSAVQLGKALNDPIKGVSALAKVGVTFTDQQREQIRAMVEAGDVMGAQKMILAELNSEFGGAAEAYGKSMPGQIAKAKNALGDIQESILSGAVPALEVAAKAAVGLGQAMSVLPRPVQSGVVIAGASALAWARWGDTALGAGRRALDFGRALSEGLDGIAATRGISKTQAGLEALKASLGQSVSEFGVFKSAAVGAAAGLASFGATTAVLENLAKFHGDVRGLGTDLDQLGRGVATLDDVTSNFGGIDKLAGDFKKAYDNSTLAERGWNALKAGMTGNTDDFKSIRQAQSNIEALDQSLADLVTSGHADAAKTAYAKVAAALVEQGVSVEDVTRFLPKYNTEIERAGRENADAVPKIAGAGLAAAAAAVGFSRMGSQAGEALRGLGDNLNFAEMASQHLTASSMDVMSAQQAYRASTQALTDTQREGAEVAQRNAEIARSNAEAITQHAKAIEDAAEGVASAQRTQADAQADLRDAIANTSPTSDAYVAAAKRVTDAEEANRKAAQDMKAAQEGLNQARIDGKKYLDDLKESASDDALSVEAAQLAYDKALADSRKQPNGDDPFAAREAALRLAQAADALDDAKKRAAESTKKQNDAEKAGVEQTPQVVAAHQAITDAAKGQQTAAENLATARKDEAKVHADAEKAVADALAKVADAAKGVADAQSALSAARSASVPLQAAETLANRDQTSAIVDNAKAKLDLAEKMATLEGRTLTAAERAKILRDGMEEGRATTGFWSGDLQTLSDRLDTAAKTRTPEFNTGPATTAARNLGEVVRNLPNGFIRVTADTSQATRQLDALGMQVRALGLLTLNVAGITALGGRSADGSKGSPVDGPAPRIADGNKQQIADNEGLRRQQIEAAYTLRRGAGLSAYERQQGAVYAAVTKHHAEDKDGGKAWDKALARFFASGVGATAGASLRSALDAMPAKTAAAAAGPTTINVTVKAEGTLVAEKDLVRTVVDAINEAGRRENRALFRTGVAG